MKITSVALPKTRHEQARLVLLASYLCSLCLAQLFRFETPLGGLYVSDFILLIWCILHFSSIFQAIRDASNWMRRHPLSIFVAVWVGISLLVGVYGSQQLRPLFLIARLSLYTLGAVSIAYVYKDHRTLLRLLLVITGWFMAWLGILQYVFLPDTRFLFTTGWDDHYYRMIGSLFDPNFMGILLILTAIFTLSLVKRRSKLLSFTTVSIFSALLAMTFSRASFVAWFFSLGLIWILPASLSGWRWQERTALLGLALATVAATLILLPKPGGEGVQLLRTASVEARITNSSSALAEWEGFHIIMGQGIFVQTQAMLSKPAEREVSVFFTATGNSEQPDHSQAPDNMLVTLLTGTGIIGTIGILALLLIWLRTLSKKEVLLAIALGATLIHSQFNNTFFEPFIFQYLLLGISAPLAAAAIAEKSFRGKKVRK